MIYRLALILIISLSTLSLSSQSIESYLDSVRIYSPDIMALSRLKELSVSESRVDILPPNPELGFGYYPGKPSAIGNKTTWSVTQSFDFPTAYARIKSLKNSDMNLALLESDRLIQQILTDVRTLAITYISANRKLENLTKRLEDIDQMRSAYFKLFKQGEVTILEYNKVDMQYITAKAALNELINETGSIKLNLDYLSKGNSDILLSCDYPTFPEPLLSKLVEEKSLVHPDFLIPRYKTELARSKLAYSKTGNLPSFSIGYGSEIVANESFTGPVVGLSIPLWENSAKVRSAKSELIYAEAKAEADLALLVSKLENQSSSIIAIKANLDMVIESISQHKPGELLNLALETGEISLTDYFIELRDYYEIEDLIYELTNRYYTELSMLWDHIESGNN